MSQRICYFKIHGQNGLALAADLTTLEGVVDSKAAAVDLTTLEGVVDGKAASADVYSKTAADALLDDKADAADLANKLEAADIAGKLDTSVHDARVTAENLFYVAMGESLYLESAVGSGTEFSYTGLVGV